MAQLDGRPAGRERRPLGRILQVPADPRDPGARPRPVVRRRRGDLVSASAAEGAPPARAPVRLWAGDGHDGRDAGPHSGARASLRHGPGRSPAPAAGDGGMLERRRRGSGSIASSSSGSSARPDPQSRGDPPPRRRRRPAIDSRARARADAVDAPCGDVRRRSSPRRRRLAGGSPTALSPPALGGSCRFAPWEADHTHTNSCRDRGGRRRLALLASAELPPPPSDQARSST